MDSAWTIPPGAAQPASILSTAGAVPVYNEKGERSMKKVKVQRYISGKRPDYAPASSDEEQSDDEDFTQPKVASTQPPPSPPLQKSLTEAEMQDPRLRRLRSQFDQNYDGSMDSNRVVDEGEDDSVFERQDGFRRNIHQAEIVETDEDESGEVGEEISGRSKFLGASSHTVAQSDTESEGEMDDEELALRRLRLRDKALERAQEEQEILGQEEEGSAESSEEEEDESEAYSEDSESETEGPRLKPVFVRKSERVTIHQKELEKTKQRQTEIELKRRADERRRETLHMIQQENRQPVAAGAQNQPGGGLPASNTLEMDPSVVNTDDEADEAEYESWKLRELRRLKRDKEEREVLEKEKEEAEKLRSMTEEERRFALRNNPKTITNKGYKGKYKFLQKYYHRGVFFLDKEDQLYTRDYSGATLEDHFDKTVLPKVMQVKNFGRSGRTKYTHLIDQDTTSFDSPWTSDTQMNYKFSNISAGGMKQVFERPSAKGIKSSSSTATQSASAGTSGGLSSGGQMSYNSSSSSNKK